MKIKKGMYLLNPTIYMLSTVLFLEASFFKTAEISTNALKSCLLGMKVHPKGYLKKKFNLCEESAVLSVSGSACTATHTAFSSCTVI